ncbi:MAG TPA: filamentous hemagglutinin N-terminal domain-containing protein [Verrucomicrobiae bacterium]|nr:filamentous hemagglutinin N-terminal domain-containing protein [Verrucomicrobiae bacterium]
MTRMGLCSAMGLALFAAPIRGQVVLDGSLGTGGAIAGPNYTIPPSSGKIVGNNLFHSFSQFSLASGETATFSGPNSIHNVLARVTGGQPSSIDGTISCTIPGANFFLINPFGIMFGPNAQVNVSGSFVATTADHIGLAGGGRFDARNPANDLLTMAAPESFGFLGPTVAPISINGSTLSVIPGKVLSLIGGDINISGGMLSSGGTLSSGGALPAEGGRVTLISAASAGELRLPADDLLFSPDVSGFGKLGTIHLSEGVAIDVSGDRGGRVTIAANDVIMSGLNGLGGIEADTGDTDGLGISILARHLIEINNGITIYAFASGAGAGGNIELTAPTVLLNGASVGTDTTGDGHAGDIVIAAGDLEITDNAQISAGSSGAGDGGNIQITVSSLELDGSGNFAGINAGAFADGKAGTIFITADSIDMKNTAYISSSSYSASSSPGGDILIKTHALTIANDASISASTYADGPGGNIQITASAVTLDALNSVGTDPVGIVADSQVGATGPGGDVRITTDTLAVRNGAVISASSESSGDGGDIDVHTSSIVVENAGAISSSATGSGKGGNVNLTTDGPLLVRNNGNLSVLASQGDGGDINVIAGSTIRVLDGQITAQASGNGGNISLLCPSVVYLFHSELIAESRGNGGNITIEPQFVILNGSQINANAQTGNGGNITIDSRFFLQSATSITATAPFGVPGTVSIPAPDVSLAGSFVPLNAELLDVESQLRPQCAVRLPLGLSSFVAVGRGGVPVEPDGLLPAFGAETAADEQ